MSWQARSEGPPDNDPWRERRVCVVVSSRRTGIQYQVQYYSRVSRTVQRTATMMRHTTSLIRSSPHVCQRRPQRLPPAVRRSFVAGPTPKPSEDPHAMAERFVKNSSKDRPSGQESLESVPFQTKLQNYGLAVTLVGFVTGVWWYSMNAVGRADEVSFEQMAQEARTVRDVKRLQEDEIISDIGSIDQVNDGGDGIIMVAVAAPDEIASEEEDANRPPVLAKSDRPLWKRVLLFWKA